MTASLPRAQHSVLLMLAGEFFGFDVDVSINPILIGG
ncbi:MAG: hypothetical protein QOF56_2823 [Acidobacteriaceae bacterium]|jgi:hypothetical protein|nr:hypothetical protein [Acidobacteriaceae bacterium]